MKPDNKKKEKKQKVKKKPILKNKKEHVVVVAQEFKFARLLSGNEKKTRDRVLKALKKWLLNCFEKGYEFKEDDFTRVWKGLFYAMWMSDKPLIQEELCENIAGILDIFPLEQIKNAVLMTKAGLKVLATEWYGIDQHRMDKFMMLVRRYLRGGLRCLLRCNWSLESCKIYTKMLTASDGILALKTPSYARNAMSLILHFIDCFLEELAKVSQGKIPDESIVCLLHPFCALVCGGEALTLCVAARRLLTALLRQSELGLQYSDAERAWQRMGCPPGGPEALELEIEEGDDQNEIEDGDSETVTALDPRAGRVDVVLPLLPVPAALLAEDMRQLMESTSCASRAYKRAKICLERFEQLSKNVYPLRVKDTDFLAESGELMPQPEQAARRLRALEKRLVNSSDELALRGLNRKHRKRLLAKSRAGLSIVEDVVKPTAEVPAETVNEDWHIEEATTDNKQKKIKGDTSNKENQGTNKKKPNKKRKLVENTNSVHKTKKAKIEKNQHIQEPRTRQGISAVNVTAKKKENSKINNKKVAKKNVANKKDKSKDSNKTPTPPKKKDALINNDNNEKVTNTKEKENLESKAKKVKPSAKNIKTSTLVVSKIKNHKNNASTKKPNTITKPKLSLDTPKKVKFVLKNNGAQAPIDYYKSVKQSPNIPFDSSKQPSKTNLKPSMPSPINPFFKKKLRLKNYK
ncbi:unnamed protein product [Parnassius apollo]|uniref:(apollo) hypothetical protein n=1 Tax=Parnassius apollo TaxID=110799 RepID=A0A8S3WA25_PARAO|nr:unnamed protein product [Parnassius apollo]